jgi:hypothetical protein
VPISLGRNRKWNYLNYTVSVTNDYCTALDNLVPPTHSTRHYDLPIQQWCATWAYIIIFPPVYLLKVGLSKVRQSNMGKYSHSPPVSDNKHLFTVSNTSKITKQTSATCSGGFSTRLQRDATNWEIGEIGVISLRTLNYCDKSAWFGSFETGSRRIGPNIRLTMMEALHYEIQGAKISI